MKCTFNWHPLKTICGGFCLFISLLAVTSIQAQETAKEKLLMQSAFVELAYQSPTHRPTTSTSNKSSGMLKMTQMPEESIYQRTEQAIPSWLLPLLLTVLVLSVAALFISMRFGLLNRRLKTEIAERQTAEQATATAQDEAKTMHQQLAAMSESLPLAMFQMEAWPDGKIHFNFLGHRAEELFGVPYAELLADPAKRWQYAHPGDAQKASATLQSARNEVIASKNKGYFDFTMRILDGEVTRWLLTSAHAAPPLPNGMVVWNGFYQDITAQKQAEATINAKNEQLAERSAELAQALGQTSSRLQGILDNSPAAIWAKDENGIYLFANNAYNEMFGLGACDVAGQTDDAFFPRETAEAFRANDQRVISDRQTASFVEKVGLPNGVEFVLSVKFPLFDANGKIYAASGMCLDITEQLRLQEELKKLNEELEDRVAQRTAELSRAYEALQASEFRLSKTTENAPCLIYQFMIRPDGSAYLPYASAATKTYFGVDPEDVREDASPILNLFHPDDMPNYLAEVQRAMTNHDVFKLEWRLLFPDGRITWVQAFARPEFFDNGDVLWSGVLLDITERKNAEEALRASEKRFKSILDNMQGGYLRTNSAGKVQGANPGMARILGYASSDELLGKSIEHDIFFNPSDRESLIKALEEKGEVENYELVLKSKDGTPITVEDSAHFLHDAAGNVTGIEGLLRDISERKQMEKVLLMARVAAEESNKAKSDFLANMSHEIRTPMNAVIGMTHLALQTELDERQRNYLQKIDIAARNLLGIINDILDFSKIEAGKLQMEIVDFDLNEVFQNVADIFTEKAQERGIEFLFRWEPSVPALLTGDPLRIGQILINLTSNAFKFTENGEVEISVEKIAEAEDSVTLQFSVRDTGIGLTQEQQGRLFQAFSQADTSTTRKYGGTGLGLMISKRLVEIMHGQIWLESEAGVGTTFFFTATLSKSVSSPSSDNWDVGDLAGLRVLVVDDNATSREILQSILKSFGFEAVPMSSGQMALESLRSNTEQPFDLILMDWQMPGMDGIEAARRIRNEPQLPIKPPIIMVSAFGREEIMRKAAKVGIAGFLIKPVGPSVLFDTIIQVFGKSGQLTTANSATESEDEKQKLQGLRALLVEDNEINCEVALELLSSAGINVTVANDGRQGIEAVRGAADKGQQYDVILMDCQMPVLDGYEATRLLRSEARFAHLPIIAMTANAMAGDREKCIAAGMNDHVTKPIEVQNLFATLTRWTHPSSPASAPLPGPDNSSTSEQTSHTLQQNDLPTIEPTEAIEDDELTLPGVDLEIGLSRMSGNRVLYRRILTKFREGQAGMVEEIRAAQQAGNYELATRLAHTLKGVAGNIGAQELFTAANDVEQSLKENPEAGTEALLTHVSAQLTPLLSAIASLETTVPAPTSSSPMSHPAEKRDNTVLEPLLEKLEALLQRSNTAASAVIEELKPLLSETENEAVLAEMSKAISNYDFDSALNLLPKLKDLLEKDNNGE